ncbi:MAG TPA: hypothetical protein ENI64_11225 [Gammaproteobacteria bacterium]|nr:hypothetical protein [Gammaproteobacteria bacterium]
MILRHFYRKKISGQAKPTLQAEPMVRCEQCGVHLPRSDALQHTQQWFCSSKHLQAFLDKHE